MEDHAQPLIDLRSAAQVERDRLVGEALAIARGGDLTRTTRKLAEAKRFAPLAAEQTILVLRTCFESRPRPRFPKLLSHVNAHY